ncbi:S8 family serine peptidase [Aquibacillus sediminis]|uniref:S8 family serine peptidase n=1 Tax=Aquibacillus sediminis TaxID=2574734 RepID=UPI001487181B|nr:S8 family serine peptidase [Aquibacillus sediminis]
MKDKHAWIYIWMLIVPLMLINTTSNLMAKETTENQQILVHYKEDATNERWTELGLEQVKTSSSLMDQNIAVLQVPNHLDYGDTLLKLQKDPTIISAEPNGTRTIANLSAEPMYEQQWYLNTIDVDDSLDISNDNSDDITVAIIDTGVNAEHSELEGKVLPGYDFVNDDHEPDDDNGHGTFVAGIIAANLDNTGMAGMSQQVKILPIKVGDDNGSMVYSDIIEGIHYAVEQGADIINMSYTGNNPNSLEQKALKQASEQGITLIAATGNQGKAQNTYPAYYPNVISVGAADKNSLNKYDPTFLRAHFSNYGPMIDVSAPGTSIISLDHTGGVKEDEGTSFATPQVSGLAAMLKLQHPDWTPTMIEWAIEKGAANSDLSLGTWEEHLGYGIINVAESLKLSEPDLSDDQANQRDQAQPIEINQFVKEKMQLPQDNDWYEFSLPEDAAVDISIDALETNLNLVATLYKQDEPQAIEEWDSSQQIISPDLEQGVYQLRITEETDLWSESDYQLHIKSDAAPTKENALEHVSAVFDTSEQLTGEATANTKILVTMDDQQIGTTVSDQDGYFTIDLTDVRADNTLTVYAVDEADTIQDQTNINVSPFYEDVTTYQEEIQYLSEKGIIHGYPNGVFKPTDEVTRKHAALMIVRALDIETDAQVEQTFTDVPPSMEGYEEISAVTALGYFDEIYQGERFEPHKPLTRGEMAFILAKAFELEGQSDEKTLSDIEGYWAEDSIHALNNAEVTKGYHDGTYRPDTTLSRLHFSIFMYRAMN